ISTQAIWIETDNKNATDIGWQPYIVVSPTRHGEDHAVPILEAKRLLHDGISWMENGANASLSQSLQCAYTPRHSSEQSGRKVATAMTLASTIGFIFQLLQTRAGMGITRISSWKASCTDSNR
ncbi:hypothetical protein T265_14153, partial [Opisthorchis viverrini]